MRGIIVIVCCILLLTCDAQAVVVKARISIQPEAKGSADTLAPSITITSPDIQRSLHAVSKTSSFTVIGKANDDSGVAVVKINGKEANIDEQGYFSSELLLKIGENAVSVTALDTKGNLTVKNFTITRPSDGKISIADAAPSTSPAQPIKGIASGKYYALLIAVENYVSPEINRLDYPVNDAIRLKSVLTQHYTFDENNVVLLKNPDRKTISKTFNDLRLKLTDKDNLLVFYAGHGVWMDDMKEGYWLPQDASGINDPTDWISNGTIRNYIRALKAKHVLLVADACFAGGIFKVRSAFNSSPASVEKIYEMPSRKAITSGAMKTVPDRSIFIEYLSQRLRETQEKYLDAQKLFISFKEAVINNSPNNQTPLYGAINEAGDEGGDFIFVRRQ